MSTDREDLDAAHAQSDASSKRATDATTEMDRLGKIRDDDDARRDKSNPPPEEPSNPAPAV